eukprot:NODE_4477_length_1886_cov_11.546333.p1 GENE.NODE_4477_length_1886_cov_11.546333~~NODE_4477_length_1886_cov_11.546333.p1  ORF type:complete len:390 (+),score=118.49 NODE_4477_length_1886_cov_11.546333:424-1593(+)
MYRVDLFNSTRCSDAACLPLLHANVTSAAHAKLADRLAAESVVLLKNEGSILPIQSTVRSIAVIGSAAIAQPQPESSDAADYYSGGGSGHVSADNVITPLEALSRRAMAAGINVVGSTTDNPEDAAKAAQGADVAIVVAATTSGEEADRANLSLDNGADALISAVVEANKQTVVLMQTPGAVVMPWRDSTQAIAALFLGGQGTGNAWASVVFGDVAPAGRLPITMPATEADTIAPSEELQMSYDEGLATGYRNPAFSAAFAFGHGLTYTEFEFLQPQSAPCGSGSAVCITVEVRNIGNVRARAVPQVYLEFPPEAKYPVPLLRGFNKTGPLAPNASELVSIRLSTAELSYYDRGTWVKASCVSVHVAASSVDVRHTMQLCPGAHTVLFV